MQVNYQIPTDEDFEDSSGNQMNSDQRNSFSNCFKFYLTFKKRTNTNIRYRLRRIIYFIKIFLAHLFSTTGLCALVIGYSCLGAFLFVYLESTNEIKVHHNMEFELKKCVYDLWNYTISMNVFYPDIWKNKAISRIKNFEEQVINAVQKEGYSLDSEISPQWSFSGALLYSVTVITTIGFGNVTCKTDWGRIATILYAIIGIPITFLCLTNLGNLLAEAFRLGYHGILCSCCSKMTSIKNKTKISKLKLKNKLNNNQLDSKEKLKNENEIASNLTSYETKENMKKNSIIQTHSMNDIESIKNYSYTRKTQSLVNHKKNSLVANFDKKHQPNLMMTKVLFKQNHLITELSSPIYSNVKIENEVASSIQDESSQKSQIKDKVEKRVPILLVMLLVIGYILLGTFMFSLWESWTLIEGAYFCFTTLTTIGFGDLVPGSARLSQNKDEQKKFIICCFYMMIGLSLIAMSINLVQEEIIIKCRRLGQRLGFIAE